MWAGVVPEVSYREFVCATCDVEQTGDSVCFVCGEKMSARCHSSTTNAFHWLPGMDLFA